jgi:septal ring factor EnvC (AmiA/AmiB activator)
MLTTRRKPIRWAHYRSELRRPVPLMLLAAAILGWLLLARLAWVHSESNHDARRQARLLTVAETTARTELEQLRQTGGTMAGLQGRITAAQGTLAQLEQSRAEARARLAEIEGNLDAERRRLTEARA